MDAYRTGSMDRRTPKVGAGSIIGGIAAAGLIAGSIWYANDSVNIRKDLANRIVQGLPESAIDDYAFGVYNSASYDGKLAILSDGATSDYLNPDDRLSIVMQSYAGLPNKMELPALEKMIDASNDGAQAGAALYSLSQLTTEEKVKIIGETGKEVFEDFFSGIGKAWDDFMAQYVDSNK